MLNFKGTALLRAMLCFTNMWWNIDDKLIEPLPSASEGELASASSAMEGHRFVGCFYLWVKPIEKYKYKIFFMKRIIWNNFSWLTCRHLVWAILSAAGLCTLEVKHHAGFSSLLILPWAHGALLGSEFCSQTAAVRQDQHTQHHPESQGSLLVEDGGVWEKLPSKQLRQLWGVGRRPCRICL